MSDYRVLSAGDTAIVVEFGEQIDRNVSTTVLALARRVAEARLEGVVEMRADLPIADGALRPAFAVD